MTAIIAELNAAIADLEGKLCCDSLPSKCARNAGSEKAIRAMRRAAAALIDRGQRLHENGMDPREA